MKNTTPVTCTSYPRLALKLRALLLLFVIALCSPFASAQSWEEVDGEMRYGYWHDSYYTEIVDSSYWEYREGYWETRSLGNGRWEYPFAYDEGTNPEPYWVEDTEEVWIPEERTWVERIEEIQTYESTNWVDCTPDDLCKICRSENCGVGGQNSTDESSNQGAEETSSYSSENAFEATIANQSFEEDAVQSLNNTGNTNESYEFGSTFENQFNSEVTNYTDSLTATFLAAIASGRFSYAYSMLEQWRNTNPVVYDNLTKLGYSLGQLNKFHHVFGNPGHYMDRLFKHLNLNYSQAQQVLDKINTACQRDALRLQASSLPNTAKIVWQPVNVDGFTIWIYGKWVCDGEKITILLGTATAKQP